MKVNKLIVVSLFLIASLKSMAQETFLLNYQDVDITKVTQDISKFSKFSNSSVINTFY